MEEERYPFKPFKASLAKEEIEKITGQKLVPFEMLLYEMKSCKIQPMKEPVGLKFVLRTQKVLEKELKTIKDVL